MRRIGLATVLAAMVSVLTPGTANAQEEPLPVPYNLYPAAAAAELTNPGAPPPGANEWNCQPTAERPYPVVLLHGLFVNQTMNFQTISPLLKNDGFCVFSTTYGLYGGETFPLNQIAARASIERSGGEVSEFVDKVLARTGAKKVDIVGHSEGGVVGAEYVKHHGGDTKVNKLASLGSPLRGTDPFFVARLVNALKGFGLNWLVDGVTEESCQACIDVLEGSAFLRNLNEGGVAVDSVEYLNIASNYDQAVWPSTSGFIDDSPGVDNVENMLMQNECGQDFGDHLKMAANFNLVHRVANFLNPSHPVPPCRFVAPVP
ncbi:lipase (class 2) [Tamaricihabitans halophyticus]|uniref:Lipase (Class 2) n=1 Tax=Tamaricihabitans halophyticus TaxID=1262583 RepID=A0A4R2PX59_9PSEU|nr:alpha/beta fold hydrolase [Tamaricihabitans halophyticus]TCP40772.1 lipase (class 2) [Tamaricihabitans halophyticus]